MKTFLTLTLIVFTLSLGAQTIEEFVADFERQKSMSMAYAKAMPAEKYSYRPTKEVRSFAEQMLHGSQGTFNIASNALGGKRPYAERNLEKEADLQSKDKVLRLVSESFDFVIRELKQMDPAKFDEVVARGPFKVTKRGWLNKSLEHISHHRGQCAVYLRLSGVTPPKYQLF